VAEFGPGAAEGVEGIERQVKLEHPADAARDFGCVAAAVCVYRDPSVRLAQAEPDDLAVV
jgi:hypothetical protein